MLAVLYFKKELGYTGGTINEVPKYLVCQKPEKKKLLRTYQIMSARLLVIFNIIMLIQGMFFSYC